MVQVAKGKGRKGEVSVCTDASVGHAETKGVGKTRSNCRRTTEK